jgi:hypothetical protein
MKPAWDTLMGQYADSKTTVVQDVDCTAGGKSLCDKVGVRGFPTIKWGEGTDLKDYEGGRDLSALENFAAENLGPTCGPDSLDLCDETDKKFINKFKKWDIDELEIAIEEKDKKIKTMSDAAAKAASSLEKPISGLQGKIGQETEKFEKAVDAAKKSAGYGYMQAVKKSRMPKVDPDHDPDLDTEAEGEEKKEEKKEL